jgi:glutamate-5-semialdehyde dehydrogenase
MDIPKMIQEFSVNAKKAARPLGNLSRGVKDQVLLRMAALLKERQAEIQAENAKDVDQARAEGHPAAFIDRLTLSDKVMASMVKALDGSGGAP